MVHKGEAAGLEPDGPKHRHGVFPALHAGLSYGKEQQPAFLNSGRYTPMSYHLIENNTFERLAAFASSGLSPLGLH